MILKKGEEFRYNCGSNPQKVQVINLRPHEAALVRCVCGTTRVFQCLSGTIKRTFTVNVPCNTTIIVACN